ncbi:FAD-dependent tricarballylate dehydrogenase TcuA [Imhoffiella purpurea]|uniref:TcuA: flavoprotein used to oxidize tricarballylate to cis-aconitate n=1 Tax=Imhoffiella purpurea TaxID=1249627 RepID=W9VC49_9GAMM|nr:FAD-dependent tricarballylate dehydrogenase TcuA [Imhoffiella purpurea]EXJ17009.1 TcuA: flavoprotein used to oxidize tricarballylate to cis-aconitate [Imhoffiella purpurea]
MHRPDVLIIGGGTAALCAAISARRTGASVLLAEAAPRTQRGGNTRHSRNLRFMHETETPLSSGLYPEQDFRSDLERATRNGGDPALRQLLVRASADAADWLLDAGVHFQPSAGGILPASRRTAFLLGGGMSMLNALYATAERLGVEIRYGCEVDALRIGTEGLEQVQMKEQGESEWIAPGALVACCGGAQANRDWLRIHWGDAAEGFVNRGTPFATGTLLESMFEQGARRVGDPTTAYLVAVDARSPADDGGIVTRIRCMPSGIVVDRSGRRFDDEGGDTASTRYAVWGQRLARRPGQIAYLILDARAQREAPPSLYPPIQADDLPALAERLEIPASALVETLAGYNAATRPGENTDDPDGWHTVDLNPPKTHHAKPLTESPFSAYPMRPGITFTYEGVAVDAHARVLRPDGGTIPNLFAAGMIMAPNIVPRGYVSGLGLTIGVVFGRIAGEEAARHALG